LRSGSRDGETHQRTIQLLLGLDPQRTDCWPSQATIAEAVEVSRGRIGQIIGKVHERWARDPAISRLRSELAEMLSGQGGVMSARELGEALLVARGSSQDDPLRTRLAGAVVRAAAEVERSMSEPRFLVRRDKDHVLIALHSDLASYALRLGEEADRVADEDPLLAPSRVIERLREVSAPTVALVPDARLVRLAAEVSEHAAVSSRQELYPRGMAADRALRLAQGALIGLSRMSPDQIRQRVLGRYPETATIPDPPELDSLLKVAGLDVHWDFSSHTYISTAHHKPSLSASESILRQPTSPGRGEAGEVTPEEADARQFEERLQRSLKEGSFLALLVNPKYYDRARSELCRRLPLRLVDFEGLFLEALQETADRAKVKWDLVLQTDTRPHDGDWDKLMMLVGRTMPAVESQLLAADNTMLLVYPGLLARYGQMDLLSRLSQKVGRSGGIPGLWLLLPGDNQAMIDGKPVPLIGPGQRTRIPESWLQNLHRANGMSHQKMEGVN
jgi:hypothetical protein